MVKHLIVFNILDGASHEDCLHMIEVGQRELSKIPGVTGISFGTAVTENAKFKYTLCVDFAEECIIETYKVHPIHVAFADCWFRPLATDRITTDYIMKF